MLAVKRKNIGCNDCRQAITSRDDLVITGYSLALPGFFVFASRYHHGCYARRAKVRIGRLIREHRIDSWFGYALIGFSTVLAIVYGVLMYYAVRDYGPMTTGGSTSIWIYGFVFSVLVLLWLLILRVVVYYRWERPLR